MPAPKPIPKSSSPMADANSEVRQPPKGLPTHKGMQPRARDAEGNAVLRDMVVAENEVDTKRGPMLKDGTKRTPLGQRRSKLRVPQRDGFVRRWVNEVPGRIADALAGGYAHVLDKAGKAMEMYVGTAERGGGQIAYLMEIPVEFAEEDNRLKQESLDEVDKAIYGGTFDAEDDDARYRPKSAPIKFGTVRGLGRG